MATRSTSLATFLCFFVIHLAQAGSATWDINPSTNDWNTAANWTPDVIPNGPADTATFNDSNTTDIAMRTDAQTEVSEIVFDSGASAFTVGIGPVHFEDPILLLSGSGITNKSENTQNFAATVDGSGFRGVIHFTHSASAGAGTVLTTTGALATSHLGSEIDFYDTSTAGSSTIINNGTPNETFPGWTFFYGSSSADHATLINNGAAFAGGNTIFADNSTAADCRCIINGGLASADGAGQVRIGATASAGNGTFIVRGGGDLYAAGGLLAMFDTATAGTARLRAEGGFNGGDGGMIDLGDDATAAMASIEVSGNAFLSIKGHNGPGIAIGSLEGTGNVFLGANDLTIGQNNLNTTFAGAIRDAGRIIKTGKGSLTFANANAYGGGTIVRQGMLFVTNTTGSATGDGPVKVDGGSLAGTGIIAGSVTMRRGSVLSPGSKASLGSLTFQRLLGFKPAATYDFTLDSDTVVSDQVIANGVAIDAGATFSFSKDSGSAILPAGTTFTVIRNTSANPITGTFDNLPDGGTTSVGNNTYQANYEGGDGNDLTLTVVSN